MRGGNRFGLQPARLQPSGNNSATILGTSPVSREQCYFQAPSSPTPVGTAQILGTSPKPSEAAVMFFIPGDQRFCGASPAECSPANAMSFFPGLPCGTRAGQCLETESEAESEAESQAPLDGQEPEEPSQYVVRNTFIDTPLQRSPSFERFFGERKIHSSPPSVMMDLNRSENPFLIATPTGSSVGGSDVLGQLFDDSVVRRLAHKDPLGQDDLGDATTASGSANVPAQLSSASGSASFPDASRAEHPGEDLVVGSADCPSLGSALHRFGACKPCAFVSHGVCRNDVNCEFCHLCEPGEKKRRRKEWLDGKRDRRGREDTTPVLALHQAVPYGQPAQLQQAPQTLLLLPVGAR